MGMITARRMQKIATSRQELNYLLDLINKSAKKGQFCCMSSSIESDLYKDKRQNRNPNKDGYMIRWSA